MSLAVLATLLALTAIASSAVRATRSATMGADRVKAEFGERVDNEKASLVATENRNLGEQRLAGARPGEGDLG